MMLLFQKSLTRRFGHSLPPPTVHSDRSPSMKPRQAGEETRINNRFWWCSGGSIEIKILKLKWMADGVLQLVFVERMISRTDKGAPQFRFGKRNSVSRTVRIICRYIYWLTTGRYLKASLIFGFATSFGFPQPMKLRSQLRNNGWYSWGLSVGRKASQAARVFAPWFLRNEKAFRQSFTRTYLICAAISRRRWRINKCGSGFSIPTRRAKCMRPLVCQWCSRLRRSASISDLSKQTFVALMSSRGPTSSNIAVQRMTAPWTKPTALSRRSHLWRQSSMVGVALHDRFAPQENFVPLQVEDVASLAQPLTMYGKECWPATKEAKHLSVIEVKRFR